MAAPPVLLTEELELELGRFENCISRGRPKNFFGHSLKRREAHISLSENHTPKSSILGVKIAHKICSQNRPKGLLNKFWYRCPKLEEISNFGKMSQKQFLGLPWRQIKEPRQRERAPLNNGTVQTSASKLPVRGSGSGTPLPSKQSTLPLPASRGRYNINVYCAAR